MGCTQLDISNMSHDDRVALKDYDVDLLFEEFEMKKFVQPDSFYSIVNDSIGRLKHVFLVNSITIRHFKLFGDAVTFDTGYKTIVYSLIFGMFCGVNHHRKTVIFGSAFVRYHFLILMITVKLLMLLLLSTLENDHIRCCSTLL
ncbi:hypothetical protein ZOSMA_293G00040 [Zostera marina]|uniref:Uncharacterized protein n=1 Tax=Zostera marina TaxID=29655 RepID=A0A0K9PBX4_ZOSMR|nr:hypothetical protein ZOSMA_293G00040 [Zostera marina]